MRKFGLRLFVVLALLGILVAPAAAQWTIEIVDSLGFGFASLGVDGARTPHVGYWGGAGDLMYAYKTGGIWTIETVDTTGNVGTYASLALDATGNPHISYYHNTSQVLKYAVKNGSWATEIADAAGMTGAFTSLAIDNAGNPHISYTYYPAFLQADLMYTTKNGSWSRETADPGPPAFLGQHTSIALDASGNPHISYSDDQNAALKYAYKTVGWTVETVATGDVGTYTSIALDASGNPRISYYDAGNADLKYAAKNGTWDIQTVDDMGDVGQYTSLALDAGGSPHISYYDVTNGDLKYAYYDSAAGRWVPQALDMTGDVGMYTSLVLFGDQTPFIAYCSPPGGEGVKIAYRSFPDWGVFPINSPPDTVSPDSTYSVCATVRNFGDVKEDTFDVTLTFAGMAETVLVVDLVPGGDTMVCFSDWMAPPLPDSFVMTVCAEATGDSIPANDCLSKTIFVISTGVQEGRGPIALPRASGLSQNSPNPFCQSTAITFQLPAPAPVCIRIYDMAGRGIRVLADRNEGAGVHSVNWDGRDDAGEDVPSGVYFFMLSTGNFNATRKMMLIR